MDREMSCKYMLSSHKRASEPLHFHPLPIGTSLKRRWMRGMSAGCSSAAYSTGAVARPERRSFSAGLPISLAAAGAAAGGGGGVVGNRSAGHWHPQTSAAAEQGHPGPSTINDTPVSSCPTTPHPPTTSPTHTHRCM